MSIVYGSMTVSLDMYGAGPNQTEQKPFGDVGGRLHTWMFEHADDSREEIAAITSAGAYVMGRNMFGPVRGAWDREWNGWWGAEPPYHAHVFVLTHHTREPLEMKGGTTFTFVTDGIESALAQAREAAGDEDVAIAGGAATLNQYLAAGLVDELRLQLVPFTLGAGERIFEGVPRLDTKVVSARHTPHETHLTYKLR